MLPCNLCSDWCIAFFLCTVLTIAFPIWTPLRRLNTTPPETMNFREVRVSVSLFSGEKVASRRTKYFFAPQLAGVLNQRNAGGRQKKRWPAGRRCLSLVVAHTFHQTCALSELATPGQEITLALTKWTYQQRAWIVNWTNCLHTFPIFCIWYTFCCIMNRNNWGE